MKKAKEVFVRLGGEDLIIPKEDFEINYDYGTDCTYYFIGYEDADGNECEKDGTYLNQNKMNMEKLEIGVYWWIDEDTNEKVYDEDAMREEFEYKLYNLLNQNNITL